MTASQPVSPVQAGVAGLTGLRKGNIEHRAQAVLSQAIRGHACELAAARTLHDLLEEMFAAGAASARPDQEPPVLAGYMVPQPGHVQFAGVPCRLV